MRRHFLSLAALCLSLLAPAVVRGQADPNQPDPAALMQQLRDNMNNAGLTPQDLIQQARDQAQQNGGQFDPQAFRQTLQQQGVINQNMLDQAAQMRNQFQQRLQQGNTQRTMSNLQQLMNSPDDEWAVLGAKIQRILDLSADYNQASPFATASNPRTTFAQPAAAQPPSAAQGPVAKALADLKTLLQDPNASDGEIKDKLTAYRDARQRVQTDLSSARLDLLSLVTLRQESVLLIVQVLN